MIRRQAGMKKYSMAVTALCCFFLQAEAASAADIDFEHAYDWTGGFIGGQLGYGWMNSRIDLLGGIPPAFDYNFDGFLGGFNAGYNFQYGSFVGGAVADIDLADLTGTEDFNGSDSTSTKKVDVLSSVRLRAGFAADNVVFYMTGGLATGLVNTKLNFGDNSSENSFAVGYTVGGGVEYAFSDRLSGLVEYRFTDLGNTDHTTTVSGIPFVFVHENDFHAVRAGLNYHF
jgi:outer membrane immunogenic protein